MCLDKFKREKKVNLFETQRRELEREQGEIWPEKKRRNEIL